MTGEFLSADRSQLFGAVYQVVTERVGGLTEEQLKLLRSVTAMREAILSHMDSIRKELPDAEFRLTNGDEGLVFEVLSSDAKGFHMTKESVQNALESLKEFGITLEIGSFEEDRAT